MTEQPNPTPAGPDEFEVPEAVRREFIDRWSKFGLGGIAAADMIRIDERLSAVLKGRGEISLTTEELEELRRILLEVSRIDRDRVVLAKSALGYQRESKEWSDEAVRLRGILKAHGIQP